MAADKTPVEQMDQSEFNSGISTLIRLDGIKRGLIRATVLEDWDMLFKFLKNFYKELVSQIDAKDEADQREKFQYVRKCFYEYKKALKLGKKSIPITLLDTMEDWEIELRVLEQRYGLNMPKKSDARSAMI